ncbi:Uncharacterized protein FWK35_00027168, partial [Aphis craccivora]
LYNKIKWRDIRDHFSQEILDRFNLFFFQYILFVEKKNVSPIIFVSERHW